MLSNEKEKSRIRAVQMNNLRGLLGIRRMDRIPNAWVRQLCSMKKGLRKVFFGGSAMWKGWRGDRITKREYVEECACSSVSGYAAEEIE